MNNDSVESTGTPGGQNDPNQVHDAITQSGPDGDSLSLHHYAERAYLTYAMSVVKSRSLPDVADGQKPVLRRILFAMRELGLTPSSKHIKSARVVGEVIGKYHPHGDVAVYEAMVLTAQDFTRRYPLVDGQGNFGSRDGDGAAAMRYTEARVTPISDLLLSELEMGTVDFIPNYDGSFQMPGLLPARLPFVLLNGAKGPAVGYAPEIPSHNLREVSAATVLLIKNPNATLDEVMAVLPAPDFPGGGQIISSAATIRQAYETGRGGIRMRARWRVENQARGQWKIIVDELPHGVSTAKVLSEIEGCSNPQIKQGKKELSQDQKNLKVLMLSVIEAVRDESNEQAPVRLVIEPKSSRQTPDELMAVLLMNTSLECSVPINFVMLGRDGNPNMKNVIEILREWIDFRFVTVERRTRHRLAQVDARLHILEGRMIAFVHIDEVIKIIRQADEPKAELMSRFGLSEIQAEDILEIRLRQLARLEGIKIEKEIEELKAEREALQHLLDNRSALTRQILKEIEADTKKHGDDRRTLIEEVESIRTSALSVAAVADEPCTIILSKNGWIRSRQGHGLDRSTIAYKAGDSEFVVLETRTVANIVILDNNGRAYSVKASDAPGGRGDGIPVTTLIELQSGPNGSGRILYAWTDAPSQAYLFTNSAGYGYIATVADLIGERKAGKGFMTIEKDEEVLPPVKVVNPQGWLAAVSSGPKESRFLMFPIEEMKQLAKGRGVIVMGIEDGEKLAAVEQVSESSVTIHFGSQKVTIKGEDLVKHKLHRARKGCQLAKKQLTQLRIAHGA
jgi:topoisomerase IV subunit A